MLRIKYLSIKFKNSLLLKNLNFSIKQGQWVTIIGPNGSGKSTLAQSILGFKKYEGSITHNNSEVSENKDNLLDFGFVATNPVDNYLFKEINDNFTFILDNLGLFYKNAENRMNEIVDIFPIKHLLDKNTDELNSGEKQLIALSLAYIHKPRVIILDEVFNYLDSEAKKKLTACLLKLNKKERVTIINITHNLNESQDSERFIVLNNQKIVIDCNSETLYNDENILKDNDIKFPFYVELSHKLMFYGLIDKIILNEKELVDTLWK